MTVSPRSRIFVPAAEMSSAKNSQPLVFGNFSRGCFTIASNGTSWRMVPTGYSTFGTLSLKMRIASASCWGSACLMRVFRTWGQSRMHPKVCSDTETSAEDATDTIQKANPTTSRLRLNISLPFSGRWPPWFDVDVIARPQPRPVNLALLIVAARASASSSVDKVPNGGDHHVGRFLDEPVARASNDLPPDVGRDELGLLDEEGAARLLTRQDEHRHGKGRAA